jgi:hypothetical protein
LPISAVGLIPQIVKLSDMPLECLGDLAHVLVQTASKAFAKCLSENKLNPVNHL